MKKIINKIKLIILLILYPPHKQGKEMRNKRMIKTYMGNSDEPKR